MKNILKQFMIVTVGALTAFSCNYDDSEWDKLHNNAPDPSATYYVQFKQAQKSLEVNIDPATGNTISEVSSSIVVAILGLPLSQDLTVNLTVDPSSTATPNMYTLASTSITIPAGSVSGSTTVTSVSANMPVGEPVNLVLNVSAGENNATAGTQLNYEFIRPAPCLPIPGVYTIQMSDSYGDGWQTDDGNGGSGITVEVDGVIIAEVGMCTPYQASDFPCSGTPATSGFTSATATVEIPEGSLSAIWTFPGDWWGEIGFTILDPNGNEAFKVGTGEGVAGVIAVNACLD